MSDTFTVVCEINGTSHSFSCSPEQTVLAAAEAAGVDLPSSCCSGVCTTCAAMVHEGSVYQPDAMGVKAELQEKGFTYTTESMAVLEDLKEVVGIEQYEGVSAGPMGLLEAALEPNLSRDLTLFEPEIRQALEEEVVLRFHLAAGMVERSLTEDPTVLRALDAFGEEMESIIGTGRVEAPESSEKR